MVRCKPNLALPNPSCHPKHIACCRKKYFEVQIGIRHQERSAVGGLKNLTAEPLRHDRGGVGRISVKLAQNSE